MDEIKETVSSENTLQDQDKSEEITVLPEEFVYRKKKTVTFSDTVTIQAILCVIAAIAFISVNIFNNGLAYDIYELYSEKSTVQENISDTFRVLLDFLRSTPLS